MDADAVDLTGRWVSDPGDLASLGEYGRVSLDFQPEGRLTYTIYQGDKREVMLLSYQVQGDFLVTDQLSSPRQEQTRFEIRGDRLMLFYDDHQSNYIRSIDSI
jgi:hypothetical protein